jgi:uncharacterized protein (DUF488 family)
VKVEAPPTLWTIGHSTHSIEEFVAMLAAYSIKVLADVRRFPASRKFPHFNAATMAGVLQAHGIGYIAFAELGGRRRAKPDSHNNAWRSEAFRGYADFMETPEFAEGATRLMETAHERNTAVMCSEAVWWRCHRALVSDYFKVRGWEVLHIMSPSKAEPHPYTSAATIVNGELSYENAGDQLTLVEESE